MTPDVSIKLHDFKDVPGKEFVTPNEDGSYTIVINSRLSHDAQLLAYQHAMEHIDKNHFEKFDVQQIESEAHHIDRDTAAPAPPISSEECRRRICNLRRHRRKLQKRMEEDEERIRFLQEYCNIFELEAYRYRYGE